MLASSVTALDLIDRYEALTTGRPVLDFGFAPRRGTGSFLFDSDDIPYLDLTGGQGAHALGHSPAPVIAALTEQVTNLVHAGWQFPARSRSLLLERLANAVPLSDPRFLFTVTGSEAVEAALKCARLATGRHGILGFSGGFHGKTGGALEVTPSPGLRAGVTGSLTHLLPMPYPDDQALGDQTGLLDVSTCLEWIETTLSRPDFPHQEIAGIIVEPVQGGRMNAPSPPFLRGLRELTKRWGLLLIVDEVYTGLGRTGHMFGFQHEGIVPDIVILGKALGAGLPIGVVAADRDLIDAIPPYKQTSTFAGNALACAAGAAVLHSLSDGSVIAAVSDRERHIRTLIDQINSAAPQSPPFSLAVTGRGLMLGIRVVAEAKARAVDVANRLNTHLRKHQVLALVAESTIKLTPALTVSTDELDTAFGHLRQGVVQLLAEPDNEGTSLAGEQQGVRG